MGFLCCTLRFHLLLKMLRRCEKWGNRSKLKKNFFIVCWQRFRLFGKSWWGWWKKSHDPPFSHSWKIETAIRARPYIPLTPTPPQKKRKRKKEKTATLYLSDTGSPFKWSRKKLLLLLSLILAVCGKRIVGQREINPLPGKSWCFVRFVRWIDGGKKERKSGKTTSAKLEFWMLECRVGDLNMERKSIKIHHVCALIQRQILFFFFVPTLTTFFFGCRWERSDAIHWWSKNGFPRKFPLSYGTHASTHHGSPSPFFCTRRTGIK